MTPEARANQLFKPGGFCACDEWTGSFHLEGCHFGQIGQQVAAEIRAACDEARREQLNVDQQYWRDKFFDLKQDKKLSAVFHEELWRTEERERCAKVAENSPVGNSGKQHIAAAIRELK